MKVLFVVSAYPSKSNPSVQPFVKAQIDSIANLGASIEVYQIKGKGFRHSYLKAIVVVRNMTRQNNYDIVHGHYVYSGIVAANQQYVPSIVSFMGSDINGSMNASGRLTLRGMFEKRMSRRLQGYVDGVIVKNSDMMRKVVCPEKTVIIPNGVDFGIFKPVPKKDARDRLGISSNSRYILFAGNKDSENKGYQIAVKAVSILRRHDNRYQLLSVSGLPQEKVALYMNAADVLVLPSRKEGSPNVVKEALACNLPVVATAVGDVAEMITGLKGCALAKRSAESFASAVHEVLEESNSFTGRDKVEHLGLDAVASRILSFYEKTIRSWRDNRE